MENKKSSVSFLTTLLVIMSLALIILAYVFFNMKKENKATILKLQEYSSFIEATRDSLENELKGIIVQYDSLKTNNDTINLKLEMQQDRIKKLLSLRIGDAEKIKKYEKELVTIREVLKSYIVQIDSLNTKNQLLLVENKELRNVSVKLETENKQLSQEKEELISITEEAKTLIAAGIDVVPLNKRNKENEKVDKIEKIRADFTLRKNTVADTGPKVIYLRLIRPDGVVLGSPKTGGVIEYQSEQIPYSASREINYEKSDLAVSIFWDNNGDLVKGNYKCELYCENKIIGTGNFILK
jgi:hypothetical protein